MLIYFHCVIIIFRNRETGTIQKLLTEGRKMHRKRVLRVNIQIQCVSWLVESVGFWFVAIPMWRFSQNKIFGWLLLLFNFILTPLTYLMNNTVTKQIIALENWVIGLKVFFGLLPPPPKSERSSELYGRRRKTQVALEPNNSLNPEQNHP